MRWPRGRNGRGRGAGLEDGGGRRGRCRPRGGRWRYWGDGIPGTTGESVAGGDRGGGTKYRLRGAVSDPPLGLGWIPPGSGGACGAPRGARRRPPAGVEPNPSGGSNPFVGGRSPPSRTNLTGGRTRPRCLPPTKRDSRQAEGGTSGVSSAALSFSCCSGRRVGRLSAERFEPAGRTATLLARVRTAAHRRKPSHVERREPQPNGAAQLAPGVPPSGARRGRAPARTTSHRQRSIPREPTKDNRRPSSVPPPHRRQP